MYFSHDWPLCRRIPAQECLQWLIKGGERRALVLKYSHLNKEIGTFCPYFFYFFQPNVHFSIHWYFGSSTKHQWYNKARPSQPHIIYTIYPSLCVCLSLSLEKNTWDASACTKTIFTSLGKIVVSVGRKTYGACMKIMDLQRFDSASYRQLYNWWGTVLWYMVLYENPIP